MQPQAGPSRTRPIPRKPGCAWPSPSLLSTIGGVGMWSVVVALPAIQADFGVARADASLPYTLAMLGFAGGGVVMGRLADRFGIAVPLALGTLALGARLSGGRPGVHALAGGARAWLADRVRLLGHLRAADGRHVALVRAPARHRRRHRGVRQLSRRHDLAAGGAAFHRHRRLARDPYRHRRVPARHHAAARLLAAAAHAGASHRGRQRSRRRAGKPNCRSRPRRCRCCCASPASPAAWRCRCRRCTSSPIAAISATARRAAPRCCR